MKSYTFESHDDYIEAQRKTTRRKINRPQGFTPFVSEHVVQEIARYHLHEVRRGLCHGVRCGRELDLFEQHIGGEFIGTEILEELCDGNRVVCHDFEQPRADWRGAFDVVYSNSLDHARRPQHAVIEWLRQLSPTGRLYIEWTKYSNRLGKGRNRADCYAATFDEYADMIGLCGGEVATVLECRGNRRVFVVQGE